MTINCWAILVSAVTSMIIGGLWYGPIFGKTFIHAQGWDKRSKEERAAMMKGMAMTYVWQFIASVVTFSFLSLVISAMGLTSLVGGIVAALIVWFGFIVTFKLGESLWGGSKTLFWLSVGNTFLTFLAAGAIIGAWR